MATATDIQQPRLQPVQVQAQALAQTKPRLQAQQINIQKRSQPLPKDAAKLAALNVNRTVKRDSGHSNNSNMSGNSLYTHAHTHQKNGSASSDGTEGRVGEANTGEKGLSFSQRAASPTPLLVKGDQRLLRDIDRPLPGDGARMSIVGGDAGALTVEGGVAAAPSGGDPAGPLSRKRSQYFEDAFATRRDTDTTPAKERVRSEALVLVDVRTNVIVGDEFTVVTELSAHLALRYRRPLSSIVVTLQHGACMCFGGSFAPAYVMAVYGLPSQLQPATNKRNAALIQRHMEETLGVPPARGHLRFVDVPEANLAYGGKTALGHADDLARATTDATIGVHGGGPNGMYRSPVGSVTSPGADAQSLGSGLGSRKYKTARKLSVKSLSSFRAPSPAPSELTPPPSAVDEQSPAAQLPVIPERSVKDDASVGARGAKTKKDGQKSKSSTSSVQAVSGIKTPPVPPPPASPSPSATTVDRQPSRRARRTKSFVATLLFGRSTPKLEGDA